MMRIAKIGIATVALLASTLAASPVAWAQENRPNERVVIVLRYAKPDGTLKNAVYQGRDPRTRINLMRFQCRGAINANLSQWKREIRRLPEFAGFEYVRADCVAWTPNIANELL